MENCTQQSPREAHGRCSTFVYGLGVWEGGEESRNKWMSRWREEVSVSLRWTLRPALTFRVALRRPSEEKEHAEQSTLRRLLSTEQA